MKPIVYLIFAYLLVALSTSNCATTYSFERENPDAMAEYLSKPSEKALAIFRISDNNYGYGFGDNYDSIEEAKDRAMNECRDRQRQHDEVEESCKIYMVNNEKVNEKDSGGGN